MPLYPDAREKIRAQLEALQRGERVLTITIGKLTDEQLTAINKARAAMVRPQPAIISDILFLGRHLYKSRITQDGYTIDDVLDQIASALDAQARYIPTQKATALQNNMPRLDRYGCRVRDSAVLECTAKHPRPELLSVIPKGDTPPKQRGHP